MLYFTFEKLFAVWRGRAVEQVAGQAEQHGVAEGGAPLVQRRLAAAQLALAQPLRLRGRARARLLAARARRAARRAH